jgi:hypothetical protein
VSADSNGDDGSSGGPGRREVAYRLFAAEFDDADFSYSESDEERAPNFVVTPSGARVNRLFAAGVLTEVESVNEGVLRGRVVDPSGAFVTYAGQYQPDALAFLERAEPPAFVALTGKARTFEPEDSDRVFTSVRPESINEVDAATRDRWTVTAAEATLRRVAFCAGARAMDARGEELRVALLEAGAPDALAAGIPLALDHYGTTEAYLEALRRLAVDALEQVAGERDEVRSLGIAPGEVGAGTLGPLPDLGDAGTSATGEPGAVEPAGATGTTAAAEAEAGGDASAQPATEPESASTADADPTAATASTADDGTAGAGAATGTGTASGEFDDDADGLEATPAKASTEVDDAGDADEAAAPGGAGDEGPGDFDDGNAPDEGAGAGDDDGPGDFDDGSGGLGNFDVGTTADEDVGTTADEDAGTTGEMYELDEEEREEIESEFGTDFSTGNEVDGPGEADIDVPSPDELAAEAEGAEADASGTGPGGAGGGTSGDAPAADDPTGGSTAEPAAEPATESTDATAAAGTDEVDGETADAADVDLEDAAVEVMQELDDGDGAARDAVVAELASRYGADPDEADAAIQDALMSGQCYEPADGTLKAI